MTVFRTLEASRYDIHSSFNISAIRFKSITNNKPNIFPLKRADTFCFVFLSDQLTQKFGVRHLMLLWPKTVTCQVCTQSVSLFLSCYVSLQIYYSFPHVKSSARHPEIFLLHKIYVSFEHNLEFICWNPTGTVAGKFQTFCEFKLQWH